MRQLMLQSIIKRNSSIQNKQQFFQNKNAISKSKSKLNFTTTTPSTSISVPHPSSRKIVSKVERGKLREARKARATAIQQATTASSSESASSTAAPSSPSMNLKNLTTSSWFWYFGFGIPTSFFIWGMMDPKSPPAKLSSMIGLTALVNDYAEYYAKPARDKLIPDWSDLPNVPHDIPIPHTLVLDLENTLVSSTWDRKYGWRHAKRPGVDKFLFTMAQYYEIVLFTPSPEGVATECIQKLDKNGCFMHVLFRDATYYLNGTHVKDISRLNRNMNRIVVIDDSPEEVQLQPENLIRVKPYLDPMDRDDKTLENLTPLLIEIAREGYDDVPSVLAQFQGMDADEIGQEYKHRLQELRNKNYDSQRSGFTKFLPKQEMPLPELEPTMEAFTPLINTPQQQQQQGQALTSKELVGAAPPTTNDSSFVGWLNKRSQEKKEEDMRKMEKWNEVMQKKAEEKKKEQGASVASAAL